MLFIHVITGEESSVVNSCFDIFGFDTKVRVISIGLSSSRPNLLALTVSKAPYHFLLSLRRQIALSGNFSLKIQAHHRISHEHSK